MRSDADMRALGAASKLNPDWDFLCNLLDIGRSRAAQWLESSFGKIGAESSIDVEGS